MSESFIDVFEQSSFDHNTTIFTGGTSPDDLFSILEMFEDVSVEARYPLFNHLGQSNYHLSGLVNQEWMRHNTVDARKEKRSTKVGKKRKLSLMDGSLDIAPRKINSHIAVERNRRKQMNEHLSVLRSLMPCFYVKRGDQASIIGGVVDYIKELQLVLQSLEAKKQRRICKDVISPRSASSTPRLLPQSPIKPLPFVLKLGIPISPRTPLPESPYRCNFFQNHVSNKLILPAQTAFAFSENAGNISGLELAMASSTSAPAMADVTVEFSGPNVLLKTISQRIPGQVLKIVEALENLSLEVLHASIGIVDGALMNSFTIKIGVECDLSAEDLVEEIKHTFF